MEESRKKPEKDTERPGEIQREKRVTKKKKEGWKMGEMTDFSAFYWSRHKLLLSRFSYIIAL